MATSAHDTTPTHHGSHFLVYVGVWIALVCGTILTFTIAHGERTAWTLPIALMIASTKATLVVFFFMHLKGDRGMPKIIMLTIALTLVWFITIVHTDYHTRFALGAPHGAEIPVAPR
jgi:cytochrome c oxidase subunit 4